MIINSILDNDLYKFTMQQAVLELYPYTTVSYKFINRGTQRFNEKFLEELKTNITSMKNLKLNSSEYNFLKYTCYYFKPLYLEYLKNFRYNPNDVSVELDSENNLVLNIEGYWRDTILWEVPLMALISELYYKFVENENCTIYDYTKFLNNSIIKDKNINHNYAEFGTRRRRSHETQSLYLQYVKDFVKNKNLVGTSNLYMAKELGLKPLGTVAHEWFMGNSSLCGLSHANKYALENWVKVYRGDLGIALTDTYGTEDFFKHFDTFFAKLFDGVRHDSGNPIKFARRVVKHYNDLNIDHSTKTIIFSDGLNVNECNKINKECKELGIKWSFGIGTNITNDSEYFNSKPLNMVIKLNTCNGIDVVKLSDNPNKATGNPNAVDIARKTFNI